jgi:hypothetical protein
MTWIPRVIGALTALYGISAIVRPDIIARQGELDDPSDRRSGVSLLSATVGIRDVVSGAAIVFAPCGGVLLGALGARVAFDLGDAATFGRLLPTSRARRKVATIALGWATVCAISMLWAECS